MVLQKHPRYVRLFRNFKFKANSNCCYNKCLRWGILGLKTCESGVVFYNELEAYRRALQPIIKPYGFLYCIVPLDGTLTKKSVGSRMGRGKGSIDLWYSYISSGSIIFEIKFVNINGFQKVRAKMQLLHNKLSLKTKIVEQSYFIRGKY